MSGGYGQEERRATFDMEYEEEEEEEEEDGMDDTQLTRLLLVRSTAVKLSGGSDTWNSLSDAERKALLGEAERRLST